MRPKILTGIGFIVGGIVLKYLILLLLRAFFLDCPPVHATTPSISHMCVQAPIFDAIITATTIAQIGLAIGGGALLLVGLRSRLTKPTLSK